LAAFLWPPKINLFSAAACQPPKIERPPVIFGGLAAENYLFLTAAVENKAYFQRLLAAESYPVSCSGA
jgi:hypothetical protein